MSVKNRIAKKPRQRSNRCALFKTTNVRQVQGSCYKRETKASSLFAICKNMWVSKNVQLCIYNASLYICSINRTFIFTLLLKLERAALRVSNYLQFCSCLLLIHFAKYFHSHPQNDKNPEKWNVEGLLKHNLQKNICVKPSMRVCLHLDAIEIHKIFTKYLINL